MLEHVILRLKDAGFHQIVINVHHLGDQIIDFLAANNNFGVQIHISDERDYLLDTGGGIKKAAKFLQGNEPFLVHNVDIMSNVDLKKLYDCHLETNPLATLLVSKRNTSRYLLFNKENRLCGWRNHKPAKLNLTIPISILINIMNMLSAVSTCYRLRYSTGWKNGQVNFRSLISIFRSVPRPISMHMQLRTCGYWT